MDTKVDENIETFYERNNTNIPQVEVNHYFKDNQYLLVGDSKADQKASNQLKLYKNFLVSKRIQQKRRGFDFPSIPDDNHPRNHRIQRTQEQFGELEMKRREDNSLDSRKVELPEPLFEFNQSDLRQSKYYGYPEPENIGLLEEYKQVSYPDVFHPEGSAGYEPYNPVQLDQIQEPQVEKLQETKDEVMEVENPEPVPQRMPKLPPAPSKDNYVVHHVKPNDTIGKLCLMYNVNKDVIRMANDFTGEEIYMFKTLKVPYTYGKLYEDNTTKSEEQYKKEFAISSMNRVLKEAHTGKQINFDKEAHYYLEMHNYDLKKALEEFEADLEFEKQVVEDNRQYKRRTSRQRVGIFSCFG
ncbi:unnamed protein product [Moneuplotes crassus]|uniref:LysM domain-containing protein n=1 Tax=Euplotes crassus TaxID=5936 RepID=A0AAD2CWM7_EUPCR|nr:unnamed protein product [Moneuplotes crassus]